MSFHPEEPYNALPDLPPAGTAIQSQETVSLLISAHRGLAELKGSVRQLPNPEMLLNLITLHEGKDSSAIENIVTTQDELFRAAALQRDPHQKTNQPASEGPRQNRSDNLRYGAAKEVLRYREATAVGLASLRSNNFLTTNTFELIARTINANDAGVRAHHVVIANPASGDIVYTPPEGERLIRNKLQSLEVYINDNHEVDPLISLALIHYQFEAIHPFGDGNGRSGRILNTLYLIQQDLLDIPILYLSSYILKNRSEYYRLIRAVTEEEQWLDWIHFMLKGIDNTAKETLRLINDIAHLMADVEKQARIEMKTGYSMELIQTIFRNPYCKIQHLVDAGIASRVTASRYLSELDRIGILAVHTEHRDKYFVNKKLLKLLAGFGQAD